MFNKIIKNEVFLLLVIHLKAEELHIHTYKQIL